MALFVRKQEGIILTSITKLATVSFIVSLAISLVYTIWAIYIDSFVNSIVIVGFISGVLTIVSFLSYFLFIPFIERSNKSRIYFITLLLFSITYSLFAINSNFYIFIVLAFIITVLQTLRITSFGIIIRNKSTGRNLSRNEGLMYTFMNCAWVVGPLIAGFISKIYGINPVFVLASIFVFIAFVLFRVYDIKVAKIKKKVHSDFFRNFVDFFKNKDRILAYVLGGGVNFWWSLIYLFIPLFIIRNNLGTEWIGYFLFGVALPLILFEYRFSKLASKIGFKRIFRIGFFVPFVLCIICFFVTNVYLILGLLVLASVGLAMVESTTEAYFFHVLKKGEENRFYGPYNTTIDINNSAGRIISSILLIFLPFNFIFLLYAGFMLLMVLLSFKVRNIMEKRKKE